MRSWWTRLWRCRTPRITQVYVICERGVPHTVCLDRASVQAELHTRDPRHTHIYDVPVCQHGRE